MDTKLKGWDAIDSIKEEHEKKLSENTNKLSQLICNVFNTSSGKELLEFLVDQFLYKTVASPQDAASYAYFREGQNSLVRQFLKAVNEEKQKTPPITVTTPKPEEV